MEHPFIIKTYGNKTYRILTRQYQSHIIAIKLWIILWISLSIISLSILASNISKDNQKYQAILGTSLFLFTVVTFYTIFNKNHLSPSIVTSSILFSIFLLAFLIVSLIKVQVYTIIGCIYGLSEITLSCFSSQNRGQILVKIIILVEVVFACLKLDGRIFIPWSSLLYIAVVVCIVSAICLLVMGLYLIINTCFYYQQEVKFKNYGLGYLLLVMSSICSGLFVPISYFNIQIEIWISCIIFSIVSAVTCGYLYKFREHIVMFLSRIQQSKPFRQIISIVKIQDNAILSKKFYRISQNWCTEENTCSQQAISSNTNIQVKNKFEAEPPNCLVCLTTIADVIWLPCGHLAVCDGCYEYMCEKKMINCVLCKKQPCNILKMCLEPTQLNGYTVKEAFSVQLC